MEVEIGPKTVSWLRWLRADLKTGGGKLLVERDAEAAQVLREAGESVVVADTADMREIVADGSVGVILAKDFFGAHGLFSTSVSGGWKGHREDIGDWRKIAAEWWRACQSGGKVVIVESVTPADRQKVIGIMKEPGFVVVEENEGNDVWRVFDVASTRLSHADDAYSLVLEKQT